MTYEEFMTWGAWIVALLGSAGFGSWLTFRNNAKKVPVEIDLTTVEASEKVVLMALALAKDAKEGVDELRESMKAQGVTIVKLQRSVMAWNRFGENLHSNWGVLRFNETPPTLPEDRNNEEIGHNVD